MAKKPERFPAITSPDSLAQFIGEEWDKNFGKVAKEDVEKALKFLDQAEYKK